MEYAKFILCGEDKDTLAGIRNTLTSYGHTFLGYSKEPFNILRHIRKHSPELVIIEEHDNFGELSQIIEVIDEELLSACILLLHKRNDEIFDFLRKMRIVTYAAKPLFTETLLQITDITLSNRRRIIEYEDKVKSLNDELEARKVIEKAKWLLVSRKKMTEEEAYEAIRNKSREGRIPMKDIAEAIILMNDADMGGG